MSFFSKAVKVVSNVVDKVQDTWDNAKKEGTKIADKVQSGYDNLKEKAQSGYNNLKEKALTKQEMLSFLKYGNSQTLDRKVLSAKEEGERAVAAMTEANRLRLNVMKANNHDKIRSFKALANSKSDVSIGNDENTNKLKGGYEKIQGGAEKVSGGYNSVM